MRGGFWGDAFKVMSAESYEGTLAVLETFFPKRCSRLRLLPVRALDGGLSLCADYFNLSNVLIQTN